MSRTQGEHRPGDGTRRARFPACVKVRHGGRLWGGTAGPEPPTINSCRGKPGGHGPCGRYGGRSGSTIPPPARVHPTARRAGGSALRIPQLSKTCHIIESLPGKAQSNTAEQEKKRGREAECGTFGSMTQKVGRSSSTRDGGMVREVVLCRNPFSPGWLCFTPHTDTKISFMVKS